MGLLQGMHIQQLVEAATGEPCPCKVGKGCPLGVGGPVGATPVEAPRVPRRRLDLTPTDGPLSAG